MEKPQPSLAPVYCAMYPELAKLVRKFGYALAIHGSLQRDFDLICVPWVEDPLPTRLVVDEITKEFAFTEVGEPEFRHHGRIVHTLSYGFGECFLDLSFMPLMLTNSLPIAHCEV